MLNDNQTYGLGVAKAFATSATKVGIEIVGEQAWDAKQPNYTALYQAVKASGADMVYLGGIYDNNGGQLIKDKVAVLGKNSGDVKLFAPDGFTGYPDMLKLPESDGMYLTFAGLTQDQLSQGRRRRRQAASTTTRPSTARIRRVATRSTVSLPSRSSWPRSPSPTAPARA